MNRQGSQPRSDTASSGHMEMESKKVDLVWAVVQEAQLKVLKNSKINFILHKNTEIKHSKFSYIGALYCIISMLDY